MNQWLACLGIALAASACSSIENRVAAISRVTGVAVDAAPGRGANYVHVMAPAEASLMGFNVNAFSDAQVAYYRCAKLPPAEGSR